MQKLNLKFPYFLSKNSTDFVVHKCDFTYESMNRADFKGEPMQGSLRVQMLKQFGITNVYTIEFNYGINMALQKVSRVDMKFMQRVAESIYVSII